MNKRRLTKKFWFFGKEYELSLVKKYDSMGACNAGECWVIIRVCNYEDEINVIDTLLHELLECGTVEMSKRYYSNDGSKDLQFYFSHSDLTILCKEIAGAMEQLFPEIRRSFRKKIKDLQTIN